MIAQKHPRAHKHKIGTPPPPPNPQITPPLKRVILRTWRFFLQKEHIFPGVHKIGAPISGPRIADTNFTDTRIFLISGFPNWTLSFANRASGGWKLRIAGLRRFARIASQNSFLSLLYPFPHYEISEDFWVFLSFFPSDRSVFSSQSGTRKEPKPKLLSPDIFRWGRGLPHEGVGAKKFGMSLETREIKFFGLDIPGFCRNISAVPEKFEKKKLCSIFGPYMTA